MKKSDIDVKKMINKILNDVINLEEILKESKNNDVDNEWVKSLEVIHSSMWNTLKSNGVVEIEARKYDKFDPELHSVYNPSQRQTNINDETEIIQVYKKGYKWNEIVLKFAEVIISDEDLELLNSENKTKNESSNIEKNTSWRDKAKNIFTNKKEKGNK